MCSEPSSRRRWRAHSARHLGVHGVVDGHSHARGPRGRHQLGGLARWSPGRPGGGGRPRTLRPVGIELIAPRTRRRGAGDGPAGAPRAAPPRGRSRPASGFTLCGDLPGTLAAFTRWPGDGLGLRSTVTANVRPAPVDVGQLMPRMSALLLVAAPLPACATWPLPARDQLKARTLPCHRRPQRRRVPLIPCPPSAARSWRNTRALARTRVAHDRGRRRGGGAHRLPPAPSAGARGPRSPGGPGPKLRSMRLARRAAGELSFAHKLCGLAPGGSPGPGGRLTWTGPRRAGRWLARHQIGSRSRRHRRLGPAVADRGKPFSRLGVGSKPLWWPRRVSVGPGVPVSG